MSQNQLESELYFNKDGWRLPRGKFETFSSNPKWFFKLGANIENEIDAIDKIDKYCSISKKESVFNTLSKLNKEIDKNKILMNINYAKKVPFVLNKIEIEDIGAYLEETLLNRVSNSFNDTFPENHFKAVIQDNTFLKGKLFPTKNTGYSEFLRRLCHSDICGYYYPQVLQEYSVPAQIAQMKDFLINENICLSGPIEVANALIGTPHLLRNEEHYSPLLCLSGASHIDPRLICCFKSYGLHLEFWCLSQMLSFDKKQVSEQWSGGFTIYKEIQ